VIRCTIITEEKKNKLRGFSLQICLTLSLSFFHAFEKSYKLSLLLKHCRAELLHLFLLSFFAASFSARWIRRHCCLVTSRFVFFSLIMSLWTLNFSGSLVQPFFSDFFYGLCFLEFHQGADPFFLLAGPNVIESEDHILRMAKHVKSIATEYVAIFIYD